MGCDHSFIGIGIAGLLFLVAQQMQAPVNTHTQIQMVTGTIMINTNTMTTTAITIFKTVDNISA